MPKKQTPFTEETFPCDLQFQMKQNSFEDSGNPVYPLEAFLIAYNEGISPPAWVIDWIAEAFKKYHDLLGNGSLDRLLGFQRGKGQDHAFKEVMLKERNDMLLSDMARVRAYFGVTVEDASYMVFRREEETPYLEFNKTSLKLKKVSDRYLKDLYNANPWCEEWKKEIQKANVPLKQRREYLKYFPKDSHPIGIETRMK